MNDKRVVFLALFAISPVVELLAGMSLFVTYINYFYKLIVLFSAIGVVGANKWFWQPFIPRLLLPTLYVVSFFVISYFGVDFNQSLAYRVHLLPTLLVDFFIWYVVGMVYHERQSMRYFYVCILIFSILSISFSITGLIDPEATRVMHGVDVPLAFSTAFAMSNFIPAALLFMAAMASLKKSVALSAILGLLLVFVGKGIGRPVGWGGGRLTPSRAAVGLFVLLVVAIPVIQISLPYVEETVARLLVEREDIMRLAMTNEFFRLLGENFPRGTGYYTFGVLTKDTLPFSSFTADGTPLDYGMSLHNTAMHILLEGGLVVTLVAMAMYLSVFFAIYKMYKLPQARGLAIVLLSWLVVTLFYGMLNQLHGTRYYFGVFGFAFGCYQRYLPLINRNRWLFRVAHGSR